jgi:hypothetical protein
MEQFLPGIVQAIFLGAITFVAIYMLNSLKAKKETPLASKDISKNKPNDTENKFSPSSAASSFDFGLIAGGYAVVFFSAAIFDGLFAILKLGPNDMVGLFVVLDILTAAAWIRGTNYKGMRGVATLFAVAVTGMAALILSRHTHG